MPIASWTTRTSGTAQVLYSSNYESSLTQYMAIGNNGTVLTSPTGVTWTPQTSGISGGIEGIAFSSPDSLYVVSGSGGVIYTSPTGVTWTSRTSGVATRLNGVAYSSADDLFVAVGNSGVIRTSPDGVTWTSRTSGVATDLFKVTYGAADDLFVAVGDVGVILTSPDGVTWTSRTSGVASALYGVTYSSTLDLFVVVGDAGVILTSPDGVTWTSRTSGVATTLYAIAYGDGEFTTVGAGGVALTSADGTTWASSSTGVVADLFGIAFGDAEYSFVAVGNNGLIISSQSTGRILIAAGIPTFTGQVPAITIPGVIDIPVGGATVSGGALALDIAVYADVESTITLTGSLLGTSNVIGVAAADTCAVDPLLSSSIPVTRTVTDQVDVSETVTGTRNVLVSVTSQVSLTETITPALILTTSVADTVQFVFTLPDSTDQYEAWVVNAATYAPSRYEGYGFNSFARIGNTYLGAKYDGVFELTGADDDGTDIDASVLLGKADFGTQQLKSMYNAVLGVATDGDMYLRVVHENAPSYTYKVQVSGEEMRNARVDIGRRIALRYWQIEVYNANGADFELESMKLYPVVLSRRVTER